MIPLKYNLKYIEIGYVIFYKKMIFKGLTSSQVTWERRRSAAVLQGS